MAEPEGSRTLIAVIGDAVNIKPKNTIDTQLNFS